MSVYIDLSAADLAGCLRTARRCPHATGSLSQLDEATLSFGALFPDIAPLQRAFADARHAHMRLVVHAGAVVFKRGVGARLRGSRGAGGRTGTPR